MVKAFLVFIVWGYTYGVYTDMDPAKVAQCPSGDIPIVAFNVTDDAGLLQAETDAGVALFGWPLPKDGGFTGCLPTDRLDTAVFKFFLFPKEAPHAAE